MPIIEPCIRPPAEAESLLLQVTLGCSCNTCTFCGSYKSKRFRVKPRNEIYGDIEEYSQYYPGVKKLFLMDGDALVLNNTTLLPILKRIGERLPRVAKISSYANGFSIISRSPDELVELYEHKLRLIYMGLESGSQEILNLCRKKSTVEQMVTAVRKADDAGIRTSLMVLLGLGGKKRSEQHVIESAKAINRMQPRYLSFLSLMIMEGTPLFDQVERGEFEPLNAQGFLVETYEILKRLELEQSLFFANHASNYLPLTGRLPQGKEELLNVLEAALAGRIGLKPEFFRAL